MMINGKSVEESFVDLASSFSELAKIVTSALGGKIVPVGDATESEAEVRDTSEYKEFLRDLTEVEFEEDTIPEDEGTVFAVDLDMDERKLEAISAASAIIRSYANIDSFPMPCDPVKASLYLGALEKADIPRWKYKHIHIDNDATSMAECVDSAYISGGMHAAAACVARLSGRHVEDEFIITRSKLEEDLIDIGILSTSDYLIDMDSLLNVLGTDYTIKLIPGVCDLLNLIDSDDLGNVSIISALSIFERAAADIWAVPSVNGGLRMFRAALNIAAAVKEAELAKLIAEKFKDEIQEGKEFVTLPQAESITGKTATEIAHMLSDTVGPSKLRLVECQRGGNLFVIDKSMLFENNSDNIRD